MPRKTRSKKDRKIEDLENMVQTNTAAMVEGPKKKSWSIHDLKDIKPLNYVQRLMCESYFSGANIIANGSAGTGKSYLAIYLALNDLLSKKTPQNRIIIVRSIVPSREIGHLPGDISEKIEPYEAPYKDIFTNLLKKYDAYENMKEQGYVTFMPTSFVRGLTWDDAIIIIDETQNMTLHEIHSIMTRLGSNSRFIVCGDVGQNDLNHRKSDFSGYFDALKIFRKISNVEIIEFTEEEIVRSNFVKQWITAKQLL